MLIRKVDPRHLDAQVIFDYVTKKAGYGPAEFRVRLGRAAGSSGRSWGWRAVVTLGWDEKDWYHVITHEVAHSAPGAWAHDETFYKEFFALVKKCGFDMNYSISREVAYKPRIAGRIAKRYGYKPKPTPVLVWDREEGAWKYL